MFQLLESFWVFNSAQYHVFRLGEDNQRASHCIQTTETECDLTAVLTDLKSKYGADVLSEALKGMSSDLIEFPRTASELFCPYQDSTFI